MGIGGNWLKMVYGGERVRLEKKVGVRQEKELKVNKKL